MVTTTHCCLWVVIILPEELHLQHTEWPVRQSHQYQRQGNRSQSRHPLAWMRTRNRGTQLRILPAFTVTNIHYQISKCIHSCSALPSRLSASDLTLCRNSCRQPRLLPSEIPMHFLHSTGLSHDHHLLTNLYSVRTNKIIGFSNKFVVLLQTKIAVEESSTTLYRRRQQHSNVHTMLLQPAHHIELYVAACLGLSKTPHTFTLPSTLALFLWGYST